MTGPTELYRRLRALWADERIKALTGLAGPIVMGTINMAATCLRFSWLTFNYGLFSYAVALCRWLLTRLDRRGAGKALYGAGALSFAGLLIPMTVAMVRTILERSAPNYPFFWMIYLYAAYGTAKFVMAVRARRVARTRGSVFEGLMSWLSLICAAYTVQMMEFCLIATFDEGGSQSMVVMQYLTHGAILIFTVGVIAHLAIKYYKKD